MNPPFRALRTVLAIILLVNAAFGYILLFAPSFLEKLYGFQLIDSTHEYLAMGMGALLIVLAIGALLAFLNPVKYTGTITLLILSYFALFVVDVVLLAQSKMPVSRLMPEMVYFLLICTALIRFYPSKEKVEEVKEEKEEEEEEPSPPVEGETLDEVGNCDTGDD